MHNSEIVIEPVSGKRGRTRFVDLGRRFSAELDHFVPQLRSEQLELLDPDKNPFFEHADVQLFVAVRAGHDVGRISAHIDHVALGMPPQQGFGPGAGLFGYFDAEDEAVAKALLERAENWLRERDMTRVLGPISLSIWEEPGLLVEGQDHAPMIMMGHHPARYQRWIEGAGYTLAKSLLTYELDVSKDFPPLIRRIVDMGERNERITIRPVDKSRYEEEVHTALEILNDAWSGNWGFVPFTEREIAYASKKLKPLIHPELVMLAELDGESVAFMITLPDINEVLTEIDGKLFPFGWVRLLHWLRKPVGRNMRVPLMGVKRELHNSRMASQLAFMMIDAIRTNASRTFGTARGEIGWILDDNRGMIAIADAIQSTVNRRYYIYEKLL